MVDSKNFDFHISRLPGFVPIVCFVSSAHGYDLEIISSTEFFLGFVLLIAPTSFFELHS